MSMSRLFALLASLASLLAAAALRPLIITSELMMDHVPRGYHPEQPLRLSETLKSVRELQTAGVVDINTPSCEGSAEKRAEVIGIFKSVHDPAYVDQVFSLAQRGARVLDPYDSDTYLSKGSFETVLCAQSSWLDGVGVYVCMCVCHTLICPSLTPHTIHSPTYVLCRCGARAATDGLCSIKTSWAPRQVRRLYGLLHLQLRRGR
jgi:hypothetical protein